MNSKKMQFLVGFLLQLQHPALVWSCGSDISGSSSATSEFGISFFAPLAYTYPPNEADLFPGQSLTVEQASQKVKTDLDLAISKALTVNQLYLSTPPTVNFTFVPQKVQIADGEVCFTDGTSIAISGTIVYKCSIGGGSTVAPVSGATTQTLAPTTVATTTKSEEDIRFKRALPRERAAAGVSAQPFVQSMTVTATASQPLFENQWKQIGRSVQSALEAKKLLFNDEISVNLL
ncbi:DUF5683 domain-containing protein [Caenorhabditis elegans]|uniref:DUF5683 domain-containing protein n=1 Tax=Caenorhabditis elegans TaxID=6239 RepID=O16886_CAEEL|nr:DUF5683 domain-containing protein [Caenorhabditis elegans]CCD66093.2 DUF5683 domain-containing protein [Caenorhabditis elegans]|eukprot:NP_503707.2 Uncharacterized protein CELE_C29G2.3 [Caenorhabditis elegans]